MLSLAALERLKKFNIFMLTPKAPKMFRCANCNSKIEIGVLYFEIVKNKKCKGRYCRESCVGISEMYYGTSNL